jgi:phosphate transport system substrate-binding protein
VTVLAYLASGLHRRRGLVGVRAAAVLVALVASVTSFGSRAGASSTGTPLNGTGSSFAASALTRWDADVSHAPYSLDITYSPSSSGEGRSEFTNGTIDFAVSDVGYVNSSTGSNPPTSPYDLIPISAAGIAFMYNIPGLTQKSPGGTDGLQLTSKTACLVLTGQVANWDDPVFTENGANAGVTLPDLQITPVTEEDPAGTNYVLEEYCMDEQPQVWAAYVKAVATTSADGVSISARTPGSNWVSPANGDNEVDTSAVASTVATTSGGIGVVQDAYAANAGFTGSNPARGVASVENASGDFTQPTPAGVASALAYATPSPDGTESLDFDGQGPLVYNPSTYSYLLTPTSGWPSTKGAAMSRFLDYVLTLGQKEAPSMDFATLGLSMEREGIDKVIADVPGAVDPTTKEDQGYSCGDFTVAEVQAGQSQPTCGVTNGAAPAAPPGAPALVTPAAGSSSATTQSSAAVTITTIATTATARTTGELAATGTTTVAKKRTALVGSISSSTATTGSTPPNSAITKGATAAASRTVPAAVSLTKPLAFTGFNPFPLILVGGALFLVGLIGRRQVMRRPRRS